MRCTLLSDLHRTADMRSQEVQLAMFGLGFRAGKETILSERHGGVVSVILFFPDGKQMLTGSADNTLKFWNVSDSHQPKVIHTFVGHTNWVTSAAFSPMASMRFLVQ